MDTPSYSEKLEINKFFLILSIHLVALGAFKFTTGLNIGLFLVTHAFFGIFGISLGYHKFLSHRAFTPSKNLGRFLAVVATLCFQGGPLFWAAAHRWHHRFGENKGDAHSASRGFWWSHILWLFYKNPNGYSYKQSLEGVPDLKFDPFFLFLERHSILINFSVLAVSCGIAAATGWLGLWFWLFPLRLVAVWHTTWAINSLSHGRYPGDHRKHDGSAINNLLLTFFLYGEGLHKNHHECAGRANNAWIPGQFDISFQVLRLLQWAGVAKIPEFNFNHHHEEEENLELTENKAA